MLANRLPLDPANVQQVPRQKPPAPDLPRTPEGGLDYDEIVRQMAAKRTEREQRARAVTPEEQLAMSQALPSASLQGGALPMPPPGFVPMPQLGYPTSGPSAGPPLDALLRMFGIGR